GRGGGPRGRRARGRAGVKRAVVYTHRRPEETRWALDKLIAAAHDLGVELRFDPAETRKHQLGAVDGVAVDGSDEIEGIDLGSVRCDGLVLATPAGSTGYNLANGGPVLAWGVEGYVISFIAPHSLTARPMVAAPNDSIVIHNRSVDEAVDIAVDGRPAGTLEP